jgi:hypothetical protein
MRRWRSCSCAIRHVVGLRGIPWTRFYAVIADKEYGADEMPESLGLYGGRYTIVFHPGKS